MEPLICGLGKKIFNGTESELLRTYQLIICAIEIVMGLTYAIVAGIAVPDSRRAVVLVGVEAIITALVGILAAFCSNKFIMIVFICVQSILVIASLIVTIVMIVVANELTEVTFGMVLSIVVVALVFMISGMAIAAAGIWIKLKNTPDAPIKRYKLDRGDDVVL